MPEKSQPPNATQEHATDHLERGETQRSNRSVLSDDRLRANLGKGLRAVFMEPVREPLPQKLTNLLKKMDKGRT